MSVKLGKNEMKYLHQAYDSKRVGLSTEEKVSKHNAVRKLAKKGLLNQASLRTWRGDGLFREYKNSVLVEKIEDEFKKRKYPRFEAEYEITAEGKRVFEELY